MAGDPFGLLLRQRIVFLGGEASLVIVPTRSKPLSVHQKTDG